MNWPLILIGFAPVIAVLVGILLNERRTDRSDANLQEAKRELSTRIDQVEARLEGRIEEVNSRIDRVNDQLTARIDRVADDLKTFYRDLGRHDADIATLKQRS